MAHYHHLCEWEGGKMGEKRCTALDRKCWLRYKKFHRNHRRSGSDLLVYIYMCIHVRAMSLGLPVSPTSGPIVPKFAIPTFTIVLKVCYLYSTRTLKLAVPQVSIFKHVRERLEFAAFVRLEACSTSKICPFLPNWTALETSWPRSTTSPGREVKNAGCAMQ